MLIAAGHRDVFDYGYSFYKIACSASVQQQKSQAISTAMAIGLMLAGKEEQWREFLKE